ncbi:hypothetical protein MKW92_038384 [Papaver armeniacum]|nr:hypothetical protein MKW92_038384 [Papaver armeniacum]
MADGSEELAKAREELLILRSRLTGLLDMPEPFLSVKVAIKDYLLLLLSHKTSIHESRSDLQVDLGVLRDLRPKLEDEQTEAEKEFFFNAQMSIACAQRIKSMAHQKAVNHVLEKENENVRACTQIPVVCESFKKLELSLEARCSRIPDESIKLRKGKHAHHLMHTNDGAKEDTILLNIYQLCLRAYSLNLCGSETKLAKARQDLQILRKRLTDLWLKPEPFLSVEGVINKYVLLLFRHISSIHEFVIDLQDDLAILKGLQLKLEREQTEAKEEFFYAQMSIACAQRIESMMLGKLHSFLNKEISDCFREWIEQHLDGENWEVDGENWVDMLQFADARIEELKRRAKAEGGRLREHKMDYEEFDADNPEVVIDQFMAHQKALALVLKSTNENICAYTHIPEMCESLKKLGLSLEARWLSVCEPEDIIKRPKPREGCSKC